MTKFMNSETLGVVVKLTDLFGSASPCQRAKAALLADKLVKEEGLTWADLFLFAASPPENGGNWITSLLGWAELLTPAEIDLLYSIRYCGQLTTWERAKVRRILVKVKAARRALGEV